VLGISRPQLSELLVGLARGGTVEEIPSRDGDVPRLIIQPEALRYVAVHDQFFRTPRSPYYWSIVEALPRPTIALLPLIGAALRGANIDHDKIRGLLRKSESERVFRAYASLGREEAQFCLEEAPQFSMQIAETVLEFAPELGLPILLQSAVGDSRPTNSSPDHPLRLIEDYVKIPHNSIRRRRKVLDAVKQWLMKDGEIDVAIKALAPALAIDWEYIRAKPGSGHTITFQQDLVGIDVLKELAGLWDEVLDALSCRKVDIFSPLIRPLDDLCYPGRFGVTEPDSTWLEQAGKTARYVIKRLADQYADRPMVIRELRKRKKVVGARVRLPTHPEFDTLFPLETIVTPYDPETVRRREKQQARSASRLASTWLEEPAEDVAHRFAQLERESEAMEYRWPRLSPNVAEELARSTHDPISFANVLLEERVHNDLLAPFVNTTVRDKPSGWTDLIDEILSDQAYCSVGIVACLTADVDSELQQRAVSLCDWRVKNWLEYSRTTLSVDLLTQLLQHDDKDVVSAAVVRLGGHRTDELSGGLVSIWEEAVSIHKGGNYWIATILSRNPVLLAKWIQKYIERASSSRWQGEDVPDDVLQGTANLPLDTRMGLLEALAKENSPLVDEELVAKLVGTDLEAEEFVLIDRRLESYRQVILYGVPDGDWLHRAILATRAGMKPEEIASSTFWGYGHSAWAGELSCVYAKYLKAFRDLATTPLGPEQREIVEAGERYFQKAKERELKRERQEAIYGR